jgi:hypothetical protein
MRRVLNKGIFLCCAEKCKEIMSDATCSSPPAGWPYEDQDLIDPRVVADAELALHVVVADFASTDVDVVAASRAAMEAFPMDLAGRSCSRDSSN